MTTILGFFGALQGLILAVAVASLGGTARVRQPNRSLALMLLTFSTVVAVISAQHAGLFGPPLLLILIEYTATFILPPALWHYTNLVLDNKPRVPLWVHTIPGIVWLTYLVAIGYGWLGPEYRWLPPILVIMIYLSSYTFAVALRTWQIAKPPRHLSSHHKILRVLIVLLIVMHISQVIRFIFRHVGALEDIVPLTATALIVILSIFAFRQSRLFVAADRELTQKKYASSSLTPTQAEVLWKRLNLVMARDRLFLNENLHLAELASHLSVPRSHLSQVVNTLAGSSFPDFLNTYRVKEASRLLEDSAWNHLSIEAIGYEVGFRSRAGFHHAFKRITGETPAQARARV